MSYLSDILIVGGILSFVMGLFIVSTWAILLGLMAFAIGQAMYLEIAQ